MRVQWEILLFIFVLNLSIGLVIGLGLGGTGNVTPVGTGMDASEYEQHFNGTDIADRWSSTPFSGIPLIGDIFAAFNFLWQNIKYLVDGFPILLEWIRDSFVTDPAGRLAFDVTAGVLRAIYGLLITMFLIEFIGGRVLSD